jgi:hypothetical protein
MRRDKFPVGVTSHLGWYVYRLIDPRNGETFCVGKGRNNRLFDHIKAKDDLETEDEDSSDLKFQRVKEIEAAGLEVAHVVHRHKIKNEDLAFEIEAALIDAYPGLSNKVSGHGSGDYGCRHVEQIILEYAAEPFIPQERLILISIGKSYEDERASVYEAVRGVWVIILVHNWPKITSWS